MAVGDTSASHVIFHLGGEEYGLPVEVVNSIIRYEDATPVPRAPHGVLGVINLRGRVVPVVDLQLRLRGVDFVPGPVSRIVVCEGSAGVVGLAVDSANEVADLPVGEIREVPDGVLSTETARAFTGVVEREGSLVMLLDIDDALPRHDHVGRSQEGVEGDSDV